VELAAIAQSAIASRCSTATLIGWTVVPVARSKMIWEFDVQRIDH
jgi:hypothetical protein